MFNVGGQTGKDSLLTWADGVKIANRRDRTRNLSKENHRTAAMAVKIKLRKNELA